MAEPTEADLLTAAHVNFDHADRVHHVAQLIADVRAEERARAQVEIEVLRGTISDILERKTLNSTTDEIFARAKELLETTPNPLTAVTNELAGWEQVAYGIDGWVSRWKKSAHRYYDRAQSAEKKLANLVREVRELNRQECELPSFERLADKYDPKPEGGG
jgi:PAS domain-containing protein